jgi:glycosyltransferase involved in cell wall biosynthesis
LRAERAAGLREATQRETWPLVSVVIPFYGTRIEPLHHCLKALDNQSYPVGLTEIIVVDNNGSPILSAELISSDLTWRLAHQPKPGSYAARNRGISLAKGKVIAFVDADCQPDRDWLVNGVRTLVADPGLGFVGGRIAFTFAGKKPTVVEAYDALMYLQQQGYVEKACFGATANLFTRDLVIKSAGPFDEAFLSGGDREWGRRVCGLSYRRAYSAEAKVFHPARKTAVELIRKTRRIVGQELIFARRSNASLLRIVWGEMRGAAGQCLAIGREAGNLGPFLTVAVTGLTVFLRLVRIDEWIRLGLGKVAQR